MTTKETNGNQTLDGVMNYLNRIGLKRALIERNARNWGRPFNSSGANRVLMNDKYDVMMIFSNTIRQDGYHNYH